MFSLFMRFARLEPAGGIVLVIAAVLAMVVANSGLEHPYHVFMETEAGIEVGAFHLVEPIHLWINDLLMAIFFLLVGMEIKREMIEGELSSFARAALPGIAAIGGMLVPALIYAALNFEDGERLRGWAIPAATDIAFAVGVLALLGNRVPHALKVFLLALAIMDDLGAIVIIALFYSGNLTIPALVAAAVTLAVLTGMNRVGVTRLSPYMLVGVLLWYFVLKSGIHATIAGVLLALTIPLRARNVHGESPLRHLEHKLHYWVTFGILPLFAFANSGVSLAGMTLGHLFSPVPLGIMLGLFLGKQIGVLAFTWGAHTSGIARIPDGSTWMQFYGVALLCGIGFTMSLFIGALAFADPGYATDVRVGVLSGSLLSGVVGYCVLRFLTDPARAQAVDERVRVAGE